ncbi:polysaccharide deacetylase family protein [Actinoplanes sp. CA-030573]|uniref:polysaccharide deacetylase family protein n=1 Tax=Actinoplanes sp. CA-030573 TaxID=3239898 RepID=UPI003D8ABD54
MAPISRRTALTAGAGAVAGLSLATAIPGRAEALLAGDPTGAFASADPINPRVVTHVTSMQAGHGWVAANTSAANLNDTTTYALGSQSASITTRVDGVASTLTRTGLSLNIAGTKQLRVLIRVDGVDYLQGLNVYVSSDAMAANFGIIYIQSETPDPSVRWLKDGEWKWVTLPWQSAIVTGSPNLAAVDSLRIRATSASGATCQVRLQAVQVIERKPAAAGGIVCFTYDDSYASQYTIAKRDLDRYGWPATAYTIVSNVQAGDGGNATYLTTAQLQQMRRWSGWEIGPHAMTATAHNRGFAAATNAATGVAYGSNPLSPAELDTDIADTVRWLIGNDLADGFLGHCYPQGRYNTAVQRQMARAGLAYARAMTSTATSAETMPPADPYAIRCYTLDNTSALSTLQARVDGVANHGGLLVFCCHDIVTSPATSTQFSIASHGALVDYVAGKAGVRVMTLADALRSGT